MLYNYPVQDFELAGWTFRMAFDWHADWKRPSLWALGSGVGITIFLSRALGHWCSRAFSKKSPKVI